MSLNYKYEIKKVDNRYYSGRIIELKGCQTTADTLGDLPRELDEVKREHIEINLQHGDPIPEPVCKENVMAVEVDYETDKPLLDDIQDKK